MSQQDHTPKPTVLLLTHARTASHVLQRMLSKQPNILYGEDWFIPYATAERMKIIMAGPAEDAYPALIQACVTTQKQAYQKFCEFLDDADRQGKIAFAYSQPHMMLTLKLVSDHIHHGWESTKDGVPGPWTAGPASEAHTNITVVPDSTLLRPGTVPIINFRHPVLVFDGMFRACRDLPSFRDSDISPTILAYNTNLRWQRLMYDWYLKHGVPVGIEPILVDADDYLGPEKESLMQKICDRVPGFDSKSVIYSWPKGTPKDTEGWTDSHRDSLKTLMASDRVLPGFDMRDRTLETEMPKWVAKWGQEDADSLKALIERSMPDYEYLMAHRMRP